MLIGDWTSTLKGLHRKKRAIVDVSHNRTLTYEQLASRVDLSAAALRAAGVTKGSRVALLSRNRSECFEILFACARLGALYIPLNWRLSPSEIAWMLRDSKPDCLLLEEEFVSKLGPDALSSAYLLGAPSHGSPHSPSWEEQLTKRRNEPRIPQALLSDDDPWIVLYTSGTTGHPKGALLPFRQLAYNALNTIAALSLGPKDSTITYTPLFHTGGLNVLSTPLLVQGGMIVLTDGFDASTILRLQEKYATTLLFGVPTTLEMLSRDPAFRSANLGAIRLTLCGGAPCPHTLIRVYTQAGIVFKQGYGLTEVGPNCLNLHEDDVEARPGSVGLPNLSITARVYSESGAVLSGGGTGELALMGPCVFLGYLNQPPLALREGQYFMTGDTVRVDDDGYISIVGRSKDMFISGGENVYPAEVERVLATHPAIRGVAVVGVSDSKWGEVGRAYIETRLESSEAHLADLRFWAREHLAAYKVPKEFVAVDNLPRNATGKVQKHLLPKESNP